MSKMDKKILIATFQNADNYGAMLQCLALYKVLSKKWNTSVIDYDNEALSSQYEILRKPVKNPIKTIYHLIVDILNFSDAKKRKRNFMLFKKNIKFTDKIKNIDELNISKHDVLVAGSDQIWNPVITKGFDDVYFLNSKKDVRRISYAASCGDVSVLENDSNDFARLISHFDAISVREKNLSDFIHKLTNNKPRVVFDPTLLLDKKDWEEIVDKRKLIDEKYIFVYSLENANELFYDTVNKIADETGYKVVFFDKRKKRNRYGRKAIRWYKAGPGEFLSLLCHSELVITTSFHGVALSSILNKDLFIVPTSYPERLMTLVEILGLEDRIVSDIDSATMLLNKKIDWKLVNTLLRKNSNLSRNWLMNAVEGKK